MVSRRGLGPPRRSPPAAGTSSTTHPERSGHPIDAAWTMRKGGSLVPGKSAVPIGPAAPQAAARGAALRLPISLIGGERVCSSILEAAGARSGHSSGYRGDRLAVGWASARVATWIAF